MHWHQKYRLYITQSPRWRQIRWCKLLEQNFHCERCRRTYEDGITLEVHHRTYRRLYRELMQDLEVLCNECHRHHHRKGPDPLINRAPTTQELLDLLGLGPI